MALHRFCNPGTGVRFSHRAPNVFTIVKKYCILHVQRGISLVAKRYPSKLELRVRFSHPAPKQGKTYGHGSSSGISSR